MRLLAMEVVLLVHFFSFAFAKQLSSPKFLETVSSCFDRIDVDVGAAQSSYLETRLNLPTWDMSNFTSFHQDKDGLRLPLQVGHEGLLQLGRTGADATTFTATMVQLTSSLVRPHGMSGKGEIRVFFDRLKRKHRMAEASTKYLKTAKRAILVIPYVEVATAQKGAHAAAKFFQVVSDSSASSLEAKPPMAHLDLTAVLAESADPDSSHGTVIFPSAGMSHDDCLETVYATLSLPIQLPVGVLSKTYGDVPDKSHMMNSTFAHSAALSLIPFPTMGQFTKEELASRSRFFGSLGSILVVMLILLGLFVAAWKNGFFDRKPARKPARKPDYSPITQELSSPLAVEPSKTDSSVPLNSPQVDDVNISGKETEDTEDFAQLRKSHNEVKTWRMAFSVFLYILYVAICCYTAAFGYASTTCYQGMPWENHEPFFFLFLAVKSWEIYLFAYSPSTKGHVLSLTQFMMKFVSSMFGYSDGYTDAIALNIARACYSVLWQYMVVAFVVGVVIAQWIVLAILAIVLDSSGKCFYKVLHMDVTANCIEFNEEDRYAKLLWKLINWSRFALEDLPQTILQGLFVIYVRKNLIMILSIIISLGSSFFSAYSAAHVVISYAASEIEKMKALRQLKSLTEVQDDDIAKLRDAIQRARDAGVDNDDTILLDALLEMEKREAELVEQQSKEKEKEDEEKAIKEAEDKKKLEEAVDKEEQELKEKDVGEPLLGERRESEHLSQEKRAEFVLMVDNLKGFGSHNLLKKAALHVIASQIGESQIKNLRDTFMAFDANSDGMLTVNEMKEGLQKCGLKEIPADLQQIMEDVDSGAGVLDYTEFLAATLDKTVYMAEDVCWQAFRIFDRDGSGKISKEELKTVMPYDDVRNAAAEDIMKEIDKNGDGEIDFQEFMQMMRGEIG